MRLGRTAQLAFRASNRLAHCTTVVNTPAKRNMGFFRTEVPRVVSDYSSHTNSAGKDKPTDDSKKSLFVLTLSLALGNSVAGIMLMLSSKENSVTKNESYTKVYDLLDEGDIPLQEVFCPR